jgi:hypothetical protein
LAATALDEHSITRVKLHDSLGTFKEIIERNRNVAEMPEQFCFGLLEEFDLLQLSGLVAPRIVEFPAATERVKMELAPLTAYFSRLGASFEPLK